MSTSFSLGPNRFVITKSSSSDNSHLVGRAQTATANGATAVFKEYTATPLFYIYTHNFDSPLSTIIFDATDEVSVFAWTIDEILVVITKYGHVYLYDILGTCIAKCMIRNSSDKSLLNGSNQDKMVLSIPNYPSSISVITAITTDFDVIIQNTDNSFFVLDNLVHLATDLFANVSVYTLPTCDCILTKQVKCFIVLQLKNVSDSLLLKLAIALDDTSIVVVDKYLATTVSLIPFGVSNIHLIAATPSLSFVACMSILRTGVQVSVLSSDFSRLLMQVTSSLLSTCDRLAWVGEDAIILQSRSQGLLVVGPLGDFHALPILNALAVTTEVDGCRVLLSDCSLFLHRLSHATCAAEDNPLLVALSLQERGDAELEHFMNHLMNDEVSSSSLSDLVQGCFDAALDTEEPNVQTRLLRAANLGRLYSSGLAASEAVETMQSLRVLTSLRCSAVGLAMSHRQLIWLTSERVVMRLARRQYFDLALRVCEIMCVSPGPVLVYWSLKKMHVLITRQLMEEEIVGSLVSHLQPYLGNTITFAPLVTYADIRLRWHSLAVALVLALELHPESQVHLLLQLKEWRIALDRSISVGDANIISDCVLHVLSADPAFIRAESCRRIPIVDEILTAFDDINAASHRLKLNRQSTRDEEIDFYSHLRSTLESSSKNKAMLQSAVDDQITLLRFQAQLEKTSNLSFSKLSINQTLFKCIMQSVLSAEVKFIDWHGTIAKLVKAFQVPEKVVYQLKLQCFSRLNRFDLVQSLAQEKKPPCGYLPFALVCIDAKRSFEEIEYYIEKLPSFADKYPLYFHLKRWSRAAEIAAIARDVDKLKEVQRECDDASLKTQINDIILKLT